MADFSDKTTYKQRGLILFGREFFHLHLEARVLLKAKSQAGKDFYLLVLKVQLVLLLVPLEMKQGKWRSKGHQRAGNNLSSKT